MDGGTIADRAVSQHRWRLRCIECSVAHDLGLSLIAIVAVLLMPGMPKRVYSRSYLGLIHLAFPSDALPELNPQNTDQSMQVERAGKTKRDKLAGSWKARQRTMQQKHKAVEHNDVQYEYLKQVLHAKAVADVSSILPCEEPVTAKPLCSPFISQFNHRPVLQAEIDIGHLQAKLWSGKFWKRNTVIDVSSETDTHT